MASLTRAPLFHSTACMPQLQQADDCTGVALQVVALYAAVLAADAVHLAPLLPTCASLLDRAAANDGPAFAGLVGQLLRDRAADAGDAQHGAAAYAATARDQSLPTIGRLVAALMAVATCDGGCEERAAAVSSAITACRHVDIRAAEARQAVCEGVSAVLAQCTDCCQCAQGALAALCAVGAAAQRRGEPRCGRRHLSPTC